MEIRIFLLQIENNAVFTISWKESSQEATEQRKNGRKICVNSTSRQELLTGLQRTVN